MERIHRQRHTTLKSRSAGQYEKWKEQLTKIVRSYTPPVDDKPWQPSPTKMHFRAIKRRESNDKI
jgi:hypothetical protein